MKTLRYFLLALLILCFEEATNAEQLPVTSINLPVPLSTTYCLVATLDVLTVYNPLEGQTDSDPLITASNNTIPVEELQCGGLRWMALSRDLLKRFGGTISYGDTVAVHSGDRAIDGLWIVNDTMNKRYQNRGDLLFDGAVRSAGIWKDVRIMKRTRIFY